jgi:hypothetical protein
MADVIVFAALGIGMWAFLIWKFAETIAELVETSVLDEGVGAAPQTAGQSVAGSLAAAATLSSSTPTHVLGRDTPPAISPNDAAPGSSFPGAAFYCQED